MKFDTVNTKIEQLTSGWNRSGTGSQIVLVMGSCRSVPYFNFFHDLNADNRMSVYFIDPFYFNYNLAGEFVKLEEVLDAKEKDGKLLDLVRSVKWFVHEHFENFGMFNTSRERPKHIYQFGMNADIDLTIPNYHDHFILFQDHVNFDREIGQEARRQLRRDGALSSELCKKIIGRGQKDLDRFQLVCRLSSFPEFGNTFAEQWTKTRYFWTCNHVTGEFTTAVMSLIGQRLGLAVTPELIAKWKPDDIFSAHFTPVTPYDVEHYGVRWSEMVVPLKAPTP